MKYSQATAGRIFIIRLEDGEVVHEQIEQFARDHSVKAASLIALGAADKGSTLVTGPQLSRKTPVVLNTFVMDNVYEVMGTGTLFPNEKGEPVLHMHLACGRGFTSVAGCIRKGVKVWHVMEIVLQEIVSSTAARCQDANIGFELLVP